jgi:hypothetical protein
MARRPEFCAGVTALPRSDGGRAGEGHADAALNCSSDLGGTAREVCFHGVLFEESIVPVTNSEQHEVEGDLCGRLEKVKASRSDFSNKEKNDRETCATRCRSSSVIP